MHAVRMRADALYRAAVECCRQHDRAAKLHRDSEPELEHQHVDALCKVCDDSLREMTDAEVCCGFGGTFCVKYPAISNAIVEEKAVAIEQTGADLLLAGDLGCLMNMAGKLKRMGSPIKSRHVAEVLAGDSATPPLAEA